MENLSEAIVMDAIQAQYLRENYERNVEVNLNQSSLQSNVNIEDKVSILMHAVPPFVILYVS